MGGFILPRGCTCSQIVPHAVCLTSRGQANHQRGRVSFPLGAFSNVVSIIPHHGYLPILSLGTIPIAQLRLTVDGVNLNGVHQPTATPPGLPYALSVPITLDYAMQENKFYDWPTDVVPLWLNQMKETPHNIGKDWDYEWVQADGTPYPLVTPWAIEFYLLEKCETCTK
jgi:hypothetical protein